jgi:hypothetical protein
MKVRIIVFVWTALAMATVGSRSFASQDRADRFLFACSVFPADTTEVQLRARFGPENVSTGSVPDPNGAEGDRTEGTLLFAKDSDALLEIAWNDPVGKRQPAAIGRLATHGRWRTSSGISLGTDLRTIEKLNGRPFSLLGLGFDMQGTVTSWRGGRLEAQSSVDCHVGIRLRVDSSADGAAMAALERQVTGDRVFSSGHPAMQALNPTVYELFIRYGRRAANLSLE